MKDATKEKHVLSEEDILARACRAFHRAGGTEQPASGCSAVEVVNKCSYAVLRNSRGVLAVFSVTSKGKLRRINQWPAKLNAYRACL